MTRDEKERFTTTRHKLRLNRETLRNVHGGYTTHPVRVTMDIDCITDSCGGCGGGAGPLLPSLGGPSGCVECLTK